MRKLSVLLLPLLFLPLRLRADRDIRSAEIATGSPARGLFPPSSTHSSDGA